MGEKDANTSIQWWGAMKEACHNARRGNYAHRTYNTQGDLERSIIVGKIFYFPRTDMLNGEVTCVFLAIAVIAAFVIPLFPQPFPMAGVIIGVLLALCGFALYFFLRNFVSVGPGGVYFRVGVREQFLPWTLISSVKGKRVQRRTVQIGSLRELSRVEWPRITINVIHQSPVVIEGKNYDLMEFPEHGGQSRNDSPPPFGRQSRPPVLRSLFYDLFTAYWQRAQQNGLPLPPQVWEQARQEKSTPAAPTNGNTETPVRTEVRETEASIIVTADLPGVTREDIKIEMEDGTITIDADCPEKGKAYHKRIPLRAKVREGTIKGRYQNGVLEVTLTKK